MLPRGDPPAALRIGHTLLFPLLPALLVPQQSTPHPLIPQPGTPSSASYSTWIPGSLAPRTIRLLAARSSGTLPHVGPTPPDGCDGLPFVVPVPLRLPPKIYPATSSAMYYSRVHSTLLNSFVFSRIPYTCARHWEI